MLQCVLVGAAVGEKGHGSAVLGVVELSAGCRASLAAAIRETRKKDNSLVP